MSKVIATRSSPFISHFTRHNSRVSGLAQRLLKQVDTDRMLRTSLSSTGQKGGMINLWPTKTNRNQFFSLCMAAHSFEETAIPPQRSIVMSYVSSAAQDLSGSILATVSHRMHAIPMRQSISCKPSLRRKRCYRIVEYGLASNS